MLETLSVIYCGPPPVPETVWASWNLDPALILAIAALAYATGRTRPGAATVAVLLVIFVSPLCALSAALFSARAVHHVLLLTVAAPFLAAALPRRRTGPGTVHFAASTALLWAWHAPAAYDLALGNVAVYWAMQATLLVPAVLFWRSVLADDVPAAHSFLLVMAGYLQMALLGALLTFAPDPLYEIHQTAPFAWGIAPLADQQLAGLIMWVPAAIPYAVVGAIVARRAWMSARGAET